MDSPEIAPQLGDSTQSKIGQKMKFLVLGYETKLTKHDISDSSELEYNLCNSDLTRIARRQLLSSEIALSQKLVKT